jgi:hypothetical protein
MKKLVIKEIPDKNGEITKIKVVEQTNTGTDFGYNGEDHFLLDNKKFFLVSLDYQSVCNFSHFGCSHGLCVLGRGTAPENGIELDIPANNSWLEDMREAVKAYNEYFCNCDKCIDRKCNSCPVDKEKK